MNRFERMIAVLAVGAAVVACNEAPEGKEPAASVPASTDKIEVVSQPAALAAAPLEAAPPAWARRREELRARSFDAAVASLKGTLVEMKARKEDAQSILAVENRIKLLEQTARTYWQRAATLPQPPGQ
jgi:hypothetical protein